MHGKVDFLQIRHFFIAEIGKASSKSWEKQGSYCDMEPLVAIGELQYDLHQTQK